jgi:hypothetical protein
MTGLVKDSLSIIDLPSSYLTAGELALLSVIPGAIVGVILFGRCFGCSAARKFFYK